MVLETHRITKEFVVSVNLFYLLVFCIHFWKDCIRINQIKLQRWNEVREGKV